MDYIAKRGQNFVCFVPYNEFKFTWKTAKNELLALTEAVSSLFGTVEATGDGATEPRLFREQIEKHSEYISYAFIELFSLGERETLSLLEELKNIGGKCGIRIEVGATTAIKPDGYVLMTA